jgi:transcriptional regulator with XRE-family HTH domain
MSSETFADRLATLIAPARSERAFAKEIGLSPGGLRGLLHEGNSPTLDTLTAIANARGVSLQWLATGEGDRHASPPSPGLQPTRPDPELFGRVVDRISRVYREEGVRLADIDLGRLAAERYAEIVDLAGDPDEWPALLDLIGTRVRRTLRAAAADPASVKREA